MDSITQTALGAAVGEAILGRKVGYRAALWGAIAGTIPDLDILAYPILDEVARLSWHRGYSHSLLFAVVFTPLLAWIINKIHRGHASWRDWSLVTFLVLFTHILLDSFTVYGTQLFLPFSNYMVGLNSIAIIDPAYTIPLLLGVIIALFLKRTSNRRRLINNLGLALSTVYLLLTVGIKFHVESVVAESLDSQGMEHRRYMTAPTVFNAILWRITVEVEDGYQVGYYSLLDTSDDLRFRFLPRNAELIRSLANDEAIQKLLWFSNGYYIITKDCDANIFVDLRFGEIQTDFSRSGQYTFSWKLIENNDYLNKKISLHRSEVALEDTGQAFQAFWTRLKGL